tara:strand:+ start:46080 stop:46787 length:708 start_codon:yes stop_codon:yes gene_type:complete
MSKLSKTILFVIFLTTVQSQLHSSDYEDINLPIINEVFFFSKDKNIELSAKSVKKFTNKVHKLIEPKLEISSDRSLSKISSNTAKFFNDDESIIFLDNTKIDSNQEDNEFSLEGSNISFHKNNMISSSKDKVRLKNRQMEIIGQSFYLNFKEKPIKVNIISPNINSSNKNHIFSAKANSVVLEPDKNIIHLKGNATIDLKDMKIESQEITYDFSLRRIISSNKSKITKIRNEINS